MSAHLTTDKNVHLNADVLQQAASANHNRPSTLLRTNPEHDVFRYNIAYVMHLMNLFGIDNHCVASLHCHCLFAARHGHVAAQQHKHFLHVFMVVWLKGCSSYVVAQI